MLCQKERASVERRREDNGDRERHVFLGEHQVGSFGEPHQLRGFGIVHAADLVREDTSGVDDSPGADLVVLPTNLIVDPPSNDLAILSE